MHIFSILLCLHPEISNSYSGRSYPWQWYPIQPGTPSHFPSHMIVALALLDFPQLYPTPEEPIKLQGRQGSAPTAPFPSEGLTLQYPPAILHLAYNTDPHVHSNAFSWHPSCGTLRRPFLKKLVS